MNQPFFSVIIPTYNRPERLAQCLESLSKLDYPRDRFEVVVVNDGSSMPLEPVVRPLQAEMEIKLVFQDNAGPASARNTGAKQASGQFIAFTDDDCAIDPQWLKALAAHLSQHPRDLVGGQTINQLSKNLYSTASQILIDYLYAYYNRDSESATFFASNNLALSQDLFWELAGFDTTFPLAAGEDRELCDRALHLGYSLHYVPTAKVYHSHDLTPQKFWRQHFNYGRGAYHFHQLRQRRQSQTQQPIKVEPLSFYTRLLLYPLSQSSSPRSLFTSALLLVSQVANVGGFFWERQRQRTH